MPFSYGLTNRCSYQTFNTLEPNLLTLLVHNEKRTNGELVFPDVLVNRRDSSRLAHQDYRQPIHTDLYLHEDSYHYPAQKQSQYFLSFVQ